LIWGFENKVAVIGRVKNKFV